MNTEQNYVGVSTHANTIEQTAQDQFASKTVSVNEEFHTSLLELLDLSTGYLGTRGSYTPIEALNELLYTWLTSLDRASTLGYEKKLETILDLITFLSQLQQQTADLTYLASQVERENVLTDKQSDPL